MAIEANGIFEFHDLLRGNWLRGRRVYLGSLFGLILAIIAISAAMLQHDWSDYWVPAGAGLLIFASIWFPYLYSSQKSSKHPFIRDPVHFRLDENGLFISNVRSEGLIRWPGILAWKEDRDTLLLYNWGCSQIIPKRFFASAADVDAARQLIQSKVPQKR